MNELQFNTLAKLIRSREPVVSAAKMVLVSGIKNAIASRETGASRQSITNTVSRFLAADKQIRDAYEVSLGQNIDSDASTNAERDSATTLGETLTVSSRKKRTVHERALDAEMLGSRWLADGNEAAERGNKRRAELCFDKAQYWLDRANLLTGRGERPPPRK